MTNRFTSMLVPISFAIGALLTIWGLGHMAWPEALPFSDTTLLSDSALRRYLTTLFIFVLLVGMGAKWSQRSPIVIGGILSVGFAMLAGALWPLLVTAWFAIASAILGRSILSIFRIEKDSRNWVFSFLIGAGAYGTIVGLLAHFPANYPGVYGVALAAPLILGWRSLLELGTALHIVFAGSGSLQTRVNWLEVVIAVVALVHFSVALMPEVGSDALAMHLFVPAHLALRQMWGFDFHTYIWGVMPMLGEWIFAIGYMLAGETAARLINLGFIFALAWLVRDLVLWAGGTALGARWAVLIFLSTPLTFTESSSLFIESVWSAFVVAGTLAVLRTCSTTGNQKVDLPIAGILLGCALAAKAVTFTILPALLLLLIWRYKLWFRAESYRGLLIGLGLFTMLGLIPYVTSYWLTGNPVFPFFNKLFQSPYYAIENFEASAIFGKGVTWDVLYQVTFSSEKYLESKAGAAGFQWLLLFVPATVVLVVAWQRRGLALALVGVLCVMITFNFTAYLRYIFPSFAILAAIIGVAFSGSVSNQLLLRKFFYIIGSLVVGLNLFFFKSGTNYGDLAFQPLTSATGRDAYLQSHLPIRNAVELVNRLNTWRAPVAVFSSPLTAGLAADGLYPNWYNPQFQSLIKSADTERAVANALRSRGVDFVILDANWGSAEQRLLIEKTTEKISDLGSISVRILQRKYRFQTELLKNTNFSTAEGWVLTDGAIITPTNEVIVNVMSPAYQVVSVIPGRRYLYAAKARCESQFTQGRLQVNWMDAKSLFISTDIRVFDCLNSLAEHTMTVIAPPNAALAAVYASGHTSTSLVFKEVSFRQ